MLTCDDASYAEDDRPIPPVRPWTEADQLTPTPPPGWLVVFTLNQPPAPSAIALWICMLSEVRFRWTKRKGQRQKMIARTPDGDRVLLVHPRHRKAAVDAIDTFNGHFECCGFSHFAETEQERAAVVLARRHWHSIPLPERLMELKSERISMGMALAPNFDDPELSWVAVRLAIELGLIHGFY